MVTVALVVMGAAWTIADRWQQRRRRAAETRAWCRRWLAEHGSMARLQRRADARR
jgi:hypothetical protein